MNPPRSDDSASPPHPLCDRVTCDRDATVFLLFDPRLTSAWLRDLDPGTRTVGISLCLHHANKVTVPAGWTLTDERSGANRVPGRTQSAALHPGDGGDEPTPPVRLASVTPIPEPATAPEPVVEEAVADDSVEADPVDAADDSADPEPTTPDDEEPTEEPDVVEPTLWSDDQPESLRVDSSTPLLSRAFRAAHID